MDQNKQLLNIPINNVLPNPDNPRIIFRQEEMDSLLISIKKYGVQVPITVYRDDGNYIIIDGERRWRTSKKLNLPDIPAIIQDKPTDLENLLMMFNIHSLREQWDLFTIANKITSVINLLTERNGGRIPLETELSEETGLKRITIRRCKLLIDLPQKYKDIILEELKKPKSKQKLTEDFFIEMETPLKTVKNNHPDLIKNIDQVRDNLIEKYQNNTINNIVDFRKISKIATSYKNVDYSKEKAKEALNEIFYEPKVNIKMVYERTVGKLYEEKQIVTNFNNVLYHIKKLSKEELDDFEIRKTLLDIKTVIEQILED